jgi:hypothetical protein
MATQEIDNSRPNSVHTLRLPRATADEVRAIARRERERESVIFRRLVRHGLDFERQHGAV